MCARNIMVGDQIRLNTDITHWLCTIYLFLRFWKLDANIIVSNFNLTSFFVPFDAVVYSTLFKLLKEKQSIQVLRDRNIFITLIAQHSSPNFIISHTL